MIRSRRLLLSLAVAAGVLVGPAEAGRLPGGTAEAMAADRPEVIAVNVRGAGRREPSSPERYVRTLGVYAMTGEQLGTVVQDFAFTSPTTGDHIMIFKFPDGELVNHTIISFAPDTANPGFVLTGLHPGRDTILAGKGTGRYAGRTGRLRASGWHDVQQFPEIAVLDDFYLIELDRRA
jgi:hypothetical protein